MARGARLGERRAAADGDAARPAGGRRREGGARPRARAEGGAQGFPECGTFHSDQGSKSDASAFADGVVRRAGMGAPVLKMTASARAFQQCVARTCTVRVYVFVALCSYGRGARLRVARRVSRSVVCSMAF